MNRRLLVIVAFAGLTALTGCQQTREMEAELINLKQKTNKQFTLLKQQNEFMNRKVNTLNEKVEDLTKMNGTLSEELATYANRPDEVKMEIIAEVNTRFASIAKAQEDFKNNLTKDVTEHNTKIEEKLETEFTDVRKVLENHTSFVQFVAAEQDSINRVFANRFDSRPWYQSIIGKWDDRERARKEQGGTE